MYKYDGYARAWRRLWKLVTDPIVRHSPQLSTMNFAKPTGVITDLTYRTMREILHLI